MGVWFASIAMGWALAAPQADDRSRQVLRSAAEAHGLSPDGQFDVSFTFRGTPYRLHLDGRDVRYERTVQTDRGQRIDRLSGTTFVARQDGRTIEGPPEVLDGWRRSLNSVAYFATLPRPLFDDAVVATWLGRTQLAGEPWDTVEIRFREAGGGDDHDDVFRYWFHPTTHELGYLAYTFRVNGGGVRLRKVIARHEVEGVVFVDWTNHGWNGAHTLADAVTAYEAGKLPELSTVTLEDLRVVR